VAPVLEQQLGRARLAELEIDQQPLAAASLGQAHRAVRRRDGLELVVKIQYPGCGRRHRQRYQNAVAVAGDERGWRRRGSI